MRKTSRYKSMYFTSTLWFSSKSLGRLIYGLAVKALLQILIMIQHTISLCNFKARNVSHFFLPVRCSICILVCIQWVTTFSFAMWIKLIFVILWLLSLYGLLIMYCWIFIVMWLESQFMVLGWCLGNIVSLSTHSLCVMCLLVCHTVTSFVSSNYLVKFPFCCLTMCCCLAPCTILVMLCVLLCSMYPISLKCATYLCICLSIINPRATKGYCSCLVRNLFLLEHHLYVKSTVSLCFPW